MDNENQQDLTSEKLEDYGILQREIADLFSISRFCDAKIIEFYSSMKDELHDIAKSIHEKDAEIKELKCRLKKKTLFGRIDHFIEKSSGYKIGFYSIVLSFLLSILLVVLRNILQQ